MYLDASDSRNGSGFLRGSADVGNAGVGVADTAAVGCFARGPGLRRLGLGWVKRLRNNHRPGKTVIRLRSGGVRARRGSEMRSRASIIRVLHMG